MNYDALITFLFDLIYNEHGLDDDAPEPISVQARCWRTNLTNRIEIEPVESLNSVVVRIWSGHLSFHRWYRLTPA